MNIFFLDRDAEQCAKAHCDKHCIKMILEHCQLLSTTLHQYNVQSPNIYKATHKNHPSAIWTRASRQHYLYLIELTGYLMEEYTRRYHKVHKCESDEKLETFIYYADLIPDNGWVDPPQCMPDHCKTTDTVQAYRSYYLQEKAHILDWKLNKPDWATNAVTN